MAGEGAVITVRGEATRTVAPDVAALSGSIVCTEGSKAQAMAALAAAQERLTRELSELGAVPLTVGSERSELTWSTFSTSSYAESKYDAETRRNEPTGRIVAAVQVRLAARDLGRLQAISSALAHQEAFHLHYVAWQVDEENPGWSAARRDAIQAAMRRAQDYAGALGTSVVTVEQVADAGLLAERPDTSARAAPMALAAGPPPAQPDRADAPSLDPVPQEVWAVVEARFRTSPVKLTG